MLRLAALLLVLAAGPAGEPAARTLLILGDSLTAGYGVAPDQAWPALLRAHLAGAATTAAWRVVDAGVSGDTSAGGAARLPALLRRHRPQAVLIALGGNDGLRGLPSETLAANLARMLTAVRAASAAPLVAGMLLPTSFPERDRLAFAAVFTRTAASASAALYPFLLDGVAMDPALNLPDLIHPNPAGHRVLAHRLAAWLPAHLPSP